MLTRIRKLLAPPVFEGDEDKMRTAKVLNTLLLTMMLSVVLFAGIAVPFFLEHKLYDLAFALVVLGALGTARWQMRRGRVRFASTVVVVMLWVVCTTFVLSAGGMTSIAAIVFATVTVIAGSLLGTHAAILCALACIVAGLGMVIAESNGFPLPRLFELSATAGWVDMTFALLITAVVLSLVLRGLNDALARARQSEERYRQLFEAESDAIFLVDNDSGRILEANNAASVMYGYSREELLTKRNTDLSAEPEDTQRVTQETPTLVDQVVTVPLRIHRKKDGTVFSVEITGRFFTWQGRSVHIAAIRDITERVRSEEEQAQAKDALRESHRRLEATLAELKDTQDQMVHQERLAAVGQLAAGIAHDFNNILASIVLYTQMSLRSEELSPRIRQRLEIIGQQTGRAADLVQQIMDFGRGAVLERHPVVLNSFVKEVTKLLQRTLPESIQIDVSFEPDEYLINADLTRIQQAIVNLALNARDAMPNGGEIHITLSRTVGQEIQCVDCGPVIDGEWIQIAVTDTGTGVAPDVLPHIFEPFFTTRAPLGHGLGLSQVYGIVKQHKGHIDVETEVGQGTTFRLYWPALAAPTLPVEAEPPSQMARGQGEIILLVEDDATIRGALAAALEMLDYRVLVAANGQEALPIFEQHAEEVSLVLSDWVMPSMGGLELVRELATLQPATAVLMLTGHPLSHETREAMPPNVVGWILKPPSLDQLARAVFQALRRESE
jgi:PAS domain S-box-containing protein